MNRLAPLLALLSCPLAVALADDAADFEMLKRLSPPPTLSERPPGVSPAPCELGQPPGQAEAEGETYSCGVFTVPMRWEDPASPRIDLHFMVVKANGPDPSPDPLVYLAGGPGQSAVLTGLEQYARVRERRDIVRLDQRGTGLSQRLGLEECLVLALPDASAAGEVAELVRFVGSAGKSDAAASMTDADFNARMRGLCAREFTSQGIDLDAFTSRQSARDLVALLQALGYRSFNLHGVSYGTRLAMTLMAMLPELPDAPALRAAVLDSTLPPSVYLLSSLARGRHDALLQLLGECGQDEACHNAYPNLKPRLARLLARLQSAPLTVGSQRVTATDVVEVLSDLRSTRAAYMPLMIDELERSIADTYLALKEQRVGTESPEGAAGLDLSDPVQAFLAGAIHRLGTGGEMVPAFEFLAGASAAMTADEPLQAMREFVTGKYEGETRDELQRLLAALTPGDFGRSSYVTKMKAEKAAVPAARPTAEQVAERQFRGQRMLTLVGMAYFLNMNIHCNEDYPFERYEDTLNAVHDLELPQFADLDYLRGQAASCTGWPVSRAPVEVKDPVTSTVPTLILQGAYDTRTPPFMGRRASRELAHSTLVVVPQQGHEVWTQPGYCASRIAAAFIENPQAAPDLSCLEARRPKWAGIEASR